MVKVPAAATGSKAATIAEQAAQPVVQAPPAQSTTTEFAEAGDNSGYATADSDELLSASSTPSADAAAVPKVTPDTAPPTWPDLADMTAPEAPAAPNAEAAVSALEPAAVSPPLPASTVQAASPSKPFGTSVEAAPAPAAAASWAATAEQCLTWLLSAYTYPVSLQLLVAHRYGVLGSQNIQSHSFRRQTPCAQEPLP